MRCIGVFGLCAALVGAPAPQFARQAGDVWYTHEVLSPGKHLIRLSIGGLLFGSDEIRLSRLHTFAEHYAGQTCQAPFTLADASGQPVRPIYAKQFVFRCVRERGRGTHVLRSKG